MAAVLMVKKAALFQKILNKSRLRGADGWPGAPGLQGYLAHKNPPPPLGSQQDPTVGICLGTNGGPRGWAVSYERSTAAAKPGEGNTPHLTNLARRVILHQPLHFWVDYQLLHYWVHSTPCARAAT